MFQPNASPGGAPEAELRRANMKIFAICKQ